MQCQLLSSQTPEDRELVVSACAGELHQYPLLPFSLPPLFFLLLLLFPFLAHTHTSWVYLNVVSSSETKLPQLRKVISYLPNLSPD